MTEYALIVALVGVLCIGVVGKLGATLQTTVAKSTDSLSRRVTQKVDRAGKGGGSSSTSGGGGDYSSTAADDEEQPGKPGKKPQQ